MQKIINQPWKNNFAHITGRDWLHLPTEDQDLYIEKAFNYWRQRDFPYPNLSQAEINKRFLRLVSTKSELIFLLKDELQASTIGLGLANYFHPQMWSIRFAGYRTPVECFEDDDLLIDCLRKAMLLWPKRRGTRPYALRDMLRTYRHARRVSNFRPAVAKALYKRYSQPDSRILDVSAGFGGRLLGCLSLNRHYIGYDPCALQIDGLRNMYQSIADLEISKSKVKLYQVCAEDAINQEENESFDLIFSSPPYFDREKYSNEETQSYKRYPEYDLWKQQFLYVIIRESFRILKSDGFLILNVADLDNASIATDSKNFALKYFELVRTYGLRMSYHNFNRSKNRNKFFHQEPIYVFKK